MDLKPLTVWAASDGRAGIEAQAVGLAEAVARLRPVHLDIKRIVWRAGIGRLPTWANVAPRLTIAPRSGVAPPWPDIWIAAGRATLPISTRIKSWSRGRTFVVQTQDPRMALDAFDLVIPPAHDGLSGDNVFPILGAPNRVTAHRLSAGLLRVADQLEGMPHPRIAVIVGGKSKSHDLTVTEAAVLGRQIADAARATGGALLVSFTRRTPAGAEAAMRHELAGLPGVIWDGRSENPYFGFLAAADAILVTEDSTNLATDAAATGKPLYVLPMSGGSAKFAVFHDALRARGVSRPFEGVIDTWTYLPLAETERAAAELLRRYDLRG